jgi:hypothetical protein
MTIGDTVARSSKGASTGRTGQVIELLEGYARVHWTRKAKGEPMSQRNWIKEGDLVVVKRAEPVSDRPLTWEILLVAVGQGKMPMVEVIENGHQGTVTVIKDNGRHRGIGVLFPGLNYDTWFHDDPTGNDKRSRYLHQLKLSRP